MNLALEPNQRAFLSIMGTIAQLEADMIRERTRSGIEAAKAAEIEFLARSEHRVTALAALARWPQSRVDLLEMTGTSRSTIGRTLHEFEERQWITKDGHQFEATQLGRFVAAGMRELIDRFETEQQLRDVWQWLPSETSGFTIEMASDAVVTAAEADDPYGPVNRFVSLLRETDRFRFVGYDVALLEPCKDELRQRILDGMQTEVIDPPSVARYILSTYEDHCSKTLESGNLTVQMHEELPTMESVSSTTESQSVATIRRAERSRYSSIPTLRRHVSGRNPRTSPIDARHDHSPLNQSWNDRIDIVGRSTS